MKLLLDTHIWLWWVNHTGELPTSHCNYIEQADELYISAISCWEVAYLHHRQRIQLSIDIEQWLEDAITDSGIICLPCSRAIATFAAKLPEHHRDPADRFIIATAVVQDCHVMSFDTKFGLYEVLNSKHIGRKLNFESYPKS